MGFFEHSKKAGRFTALVFAFVITGTLSIMLAIKDPTAIADLIHTWMGVLFVCTGFYFATKTSDKQ